MLHCTLPSTPELRLLPSDPLPPPVDDVKQLEAQEARLNAVVRALQQRGECGHHHALFPPCALTPAPRPQLEGLTKHKAEQPLGIARRGPEGAWDGCAQGRCCRHSLVRGQSALPKLLPSSNGLAL